MPTGEHCWKKNSGAQWARTSNLWIPSLSCSLLSNVGRYVEWDLNFYCTVYIKLQCYTSLQNRAIDQLHQACMFIKTENIAVDEIGRIISLHLLARAQQYFYIKLLCMHDAMTCNIVAIL